MGGGGVYRSARSQEFCFLTRVPICNDRQAVALPERRDRERKETDEKKRATISPPPSPPSSVPPTHSSHTDSLRSTAPPLVSRRILLKSWSVLR